MHNRAEYTFMHVLFCVFIALKQLCADFICLAALFLYYKVKP